MSQRCVNAKRHNLGRDPRTSKVKWICKLTCEICRGASLVDDCRDCGGAGLRVGGLPCLTCRNTGKIPALTISK